MTRSRELLRIERAVKRPSDAELHWALAECQLRKKYAKQHSHLWRQIEKEVRAALKLLKSRNE